MTSFFNINKIIRSICFLVFFTANNSFAQQISLAGEWRFAIDREDVGIQDSTAQWSLNNLPVGQNVLI